MKAYLKTITGVICWLAAITASAQKLPAVQPVSLYAPNHKTGNILTAFDNKFQAYNKGNHLYYTIANDDNNLYLVARTSDRDAIQKIVRWGLALTVSNSGKITQGSPSVSFPIPDHDKNIDMIRSDVAKDRNAQIPVVCKLIAVKGLTGINEPAISVYNNNGIKTSAIFNDKLEYTYELTVPLKYLNISVKDKTRFRYNVKLNGRGPVNPLAPAGPVRRDGRPTRNTDYLDSPTDFSGTCMLATK